MITLTFGFIALAWGLLSAYYAWRFVLRRKPQSIHIALSMLAWPWLVGRELNWIPRAPTTVFLAAAVSVGVLGLVVVYRYESPRRRPFR